MQQLSPAQPDQATASERTLYVTVDGPLVEANLPVEAAVAFVRSSPRNLLVLLGWLLRGPGYCRNRLVGQDLIDGSLLPISRPFADELREQARRGTHICLVSNGWTAITPAVASRLDCVGSVADRTGTGETATVGSSGARPLSGTLRIWLKQARIHQWLKNLLIFVPLLTAHSFSFRSILPASVTFVAFGLVASATYIINDLLDLQNDRRHPRKSSRPMASGAISASQGLCASVLLLLAGLALAATVSPATALVAGAYTVLTLAYSITFKTYVLIDVLLLATLFTIRILAGALAIDVPLSSWLLAFSMFTFLSLALVKRASELIAMEKLLRDRAEGRDYSSLDRSAITTMGIASGYLSVLVLALFVDSAEGGMSYSRPDLLWLLCPLMLYWVSRLWLKTGRGEMHDDPLLYSMRDKASWCVVLGMVAVVLLAI